MTTILDGKMVSNKMTDILKEKIKNFKILPKLVIILVGEDYSSKVYVNMKKKKCEEIGLTCEVLKFDENATQSEIENTVTTLGKDENVAGIMIQHPMPAHIDEQACFNLIPYEKDVDGLSAQSFGFIAQKREYFVPATAFGVIKLIEEYNIDLVGKKVLVVGKSQIVGMPLTVMLLNRSATVTVASRHTTNLPEIVKDFDIVIVAIGKPEYVKADWFREGTVIIDVGYNKGCVGDIEKAAYEKASYVAPVPGGAGPMTIACLLWQTVNAIEKLQK